MDLNPGTATEEAIEEAGKGGGAVTPGRCHLMLTGDVEHKTSKGSAPMVVEFEVLAHDDKACVGTCPKHWFFTSEKAIKFFVDLLVKCGVRTKEQLKSGDWPDSEELAGRQILAKFRDEKDDDDGTVRCKLNVFELWACTSAEDVPQGWPVNEGMLKRQPPRAGGTAAGKAAADPAGGF